MKAKPIALYLQKTLPRYTDKFTDKIVVSEIVAENGTAIATLASPLPASFQSNLTSSIQGAVIVVPITNFVVNNGLATLSTVPIDHGLVLGFNFKDRTSTTIAYIRGFADNNLNGDFIVDDVPNRYTFTFKTTLSNGTYFTDGYILNYVSSILNDLTDVTVIDSTHISYPVPEVTDEIRTVEPCEFHYNTRIAVAGNIAKTDRAYTSYEKSGYLTDKFWAFVVAENTIMSKDRRVETDVTTSPGINAESRTYLTYEDFNVCVYAPVSEQTLAGVARDEMEDIKISLFSTLLYYQNDQQYACQNKYLTSFLGDSEIQLDRDRLARAYTFQCQYQVGMRDGNITQAQLTPFRDLYFIANPSETVSLEQKHVNLDEFPIG